MIVYLLEYETCNGEYCETRYKQAYSSEEKAKAAFDKLLDPELLKGEDAINEWRYTGSSDVEQKFRTGNWGFCVWTITKLTVDHVGEVDFWEAEFPPDDYDDDEDDGDEPRVGPEKGEDDL